MATFESVFVGARVYNNANESIADTVATALTFNSERYDTDSIHSIVLNTSRLTCNTAGKYLISGSVMWGASATGYRLIAIRLNGATYITIHSHPAVAANPTDASTYQSISAVYELVATNYVELIVQQISGGALDVVAAGNLSPEFEMARIG